MFRKSFRVRRRLFVGLAFAAFAVPAAPAAAASLSTFVDGGPAPVSIAAVTSDQSYLRYHDVGVPIGTGPVAARAATASAASSASFDWRDAGIGASTAFGVALLLVTGVALGRRRNPARLTSA
jgi:hypothetical protein